MRCEIELTHHTCQRDRSENTATPRCILAPCETQLLDMMV